MYSRIVLLLLLFFSGPCLMAQQSLSVTSQAITSPTASAEKYYHANRNESPRAIEFNTNTVSSSYFLANINQYLDIPAEFSFKEVESNVDNLGMRHRLMQQYYKNIPLEGMAYRVHEKNGFITSVNGKGVKNIGTNIQVTITEEQAFNLALKYLQSKDTVKRAGKILIVSKDFTFTPESFSIAFQFDIDVSLAESWRVSIDARTGLLINKTSLVHSCFQEKISTPPLPYTTGTGLTSYYGTKTIQIEQLGSSSRLVGQTKNGGRIGTYDFNNVNILSLFWFYEFHKVSDIYLYDNPYVIERNKPALSVQWGAEQAYEYYFKKWNRDSYDNNGGKITSYVHIDNNLDNAFWFGRHNLLGFGDGSNNNPLVELDVVSHELTHGVTQYEANLQYFNEHGALNESFSDIFAKAIEFDTFGDTATWQLAKKFRAGGMRDLSNPNLKNQPDTYAGDMWYTGYDDSGGVHYNSGVQNFWFYLLCNGGEGINDHQNNYSVNAIGMDAAINIVYRNLTEYLGYYSDYLDSRIGSLLAAADLYGKNSIAYQEVANAWDAVGVIQKPIITTVDLYDITATTVKIKGSLLPRGLQVTYHFEYGTTPALGSSSESYTYVDKVEGILTGLQSETKYFVKLVATNENGSSYFSTEFTTISLAPLVKLKETVDVTETTASLYGQINPNSLSTSFYFEYGPTPAFGSVTPTFTTPIATEYLDVAANVTGLQPRQTYYFRMVATNAFASSTTGVSSFFTAVKPTIFSYTPAKGDVGTEVTISGENFNLTKDKNIVSFGATRGNVISSSANEIKVRVPSGASLGPISLLDSESGLAAESADDFVPTFKGEFNEGSLQLRIGIFDFIYRTLIEDIDGDGKPDIVASHYQGFSVFQNVNQGGDLTDESFIRNTFPATNFSTSNLYVVDIDGNGLRDVIVNQNNVIRIYPNLSVPGFVFFGVPVDVPVGNLSLLVFDDLDLDGRIDIAGMRYNDEYGYSLIILRNQNPKGVLSAENFVERFEQSLPYGLTFLEGKDLNNDGKIDLMGSPYDTNLFTILRNNSQVGAFAFAGNTLDDPTKGRWARYVAQDLNEDGWKDIISYSIYEEKNMAIFENKGTIPFITLGTPVIIPGEKTQINVHPGDMDGDGKVDLIAGNKMRTFTVLKNNHQANETLSDLSFKSSGEYGIALVNTGSGTVQTQSNINDLNGDGRPEVIHVHSYDYWPHDGYMVEIWQNSPSTDCPDPSLITVNISARVATIVLPANTTFDQFEIEYRHTDYDYWYEVSSTTLNLYNAGVYQLRVRAKCYLSFSDYHYIDFSVDCINTNNFSLTDVGTHSVKFYAHNLSSFEIQYSLADQDQWQEVSQYSTGIYNLSPGTAYDLRYRGRCATPAAFNYKEFTTICPNLSSLDVTELAYNKAVLKWTSNHSGEAILEYSSDNVNWTLVDQTRIMFPLHPGTKYFVRGSLACTDINSDFITKTFTTPCHTVSNLNIENVTPFEATVRWSDELNTGSYVVSYSTAAGGTPIEMVTTSSVFKLNRLSPGTTYTVGVAPQCSSVKEFTYQKFTTVCYAPSNLLVNNVTQTAAELSWYDNFGGVLYSVDYSIIGSNVWLTTNTASTNVSLDHLRPGVRYEARVHISCLNVRPPHTSVFFATDLYSETTFAPNPTDSRITIHPSKNLIGAQFSIHDNTGRQLISGELREYTIDISDFSAGSYILKIEGEKPVKIIKR